MKICIDAMTSKVVRMENEVIHRCDGQQGHEDGEEEQQNIDESDVRVTDRMVINVWEVQQPPSLIGEEAYLKLHKCFI